MRGTSIVWSLITNCNHKLSSRWSHINAATPGFGAKQAFQRQKWMAWMCTDDKELAKGGNPKRPSLFMVTTWVKEAWEDIPAEMMKKSFLMTGISSSMDGTEDDHLWQDSEESSSDEEPEETWDTDERLTQQEWEDLFGESDDGDFEEFD